MNPIKFLTKIKKYLVVSFLVLLLVMLPVGTAYSATCSASFTYSPSTIYRNDTISFTDTSMVIGTAFDFESGTLPAGWTVAGGWSVGAVPCAQAYGNSTYFYWASTSGSLTPSVTTNAFDTTTGGTIEFDMAYSVQGGSSPCEGLDLSGEGVYVEYSTNGSTWVQVQYWDPSPGSPGSTPFTGNWSHVTLAIPAGAQTASTQFRWMLDTESLIGRVLRQLGG